MHFHDHGTHSHTHTSHGHGHDHGLGHATTRVLGAAVVATGFLVATEFAAGVGVGVGLGLEGALAVGIATDDFGPAVEGVALGVVVAIAGVTTGVCVEPVAGVPDGVSEGVVAGVGVPDGAGEGVGLLSGLI